MKRFWMQLQPAARTGFVGGAVLVIALVAGLGMWAMRTEYGVLFAQLAPADAAAMVKEIERMKLPYQLEDGGATILVPAESVPKTRLKLVSGELPLHGAVGLELFNNSEIGMTDFAQRINYQRAQQGELTRTIVALDEVQSARVHLALPEQGLFKKSASPAKASIALVLKPGRTLQPVQVQGIQRLVAAAVPEIQPEQVTVLDQHGQALTRAPGEEVDATALAELDGKRGVEDYLGRKLEEVLARSYGAGQAISSVDVELDTDRTKVTTEEVLPGQATHDGPPTGVVVREKTSTRDGANGERTTTDNDTDYQAGRRVEQRVRGSGSIKRLSAVVVLRQVLTEEQRERVRDLVALAVGFDKARGDAIAVYSMDQVAAGAGVVPAAPAAPPAASSPVPAPAAARSALPAAGADSVLAVLAACLALAAATALWLRRRTGAPAPRLLSAEERDRTLAQVQAWLDLQPERREERR